MTSTSKCFDFNWMLNGIHLGIPNNNDLQILNPCEVKYNNHSNSALLLLHGFSSSPAVFRLFYSELTHYQYIYAPLLKGHGKSIHDFSSVKGTDWLNQIELMLKEMHKKYEHVDILGLSLGGLIAAYLVQHFPIRQLYLLAPALILNYPVNKLKMIANFSKLLGFFGIRNQGGNLCNPKEAELVFRQLPITTILEILKLIENYQHKIWTTPTTLFLGQHDKVVNSMKVAEILRTLPRLETYFLEHSAHVLTLDNDYKFILDTINQTNSLI